MGMAGGMGWLSYDSSAVRLARPGAFYGLGGIAIQAPNLGPYTTCPCSFAATSVAGGGDV